jgi:hypothetical protein
MSETNHGVSARFAVAPFTIRLVGVVSTEGVAEGDWADAPAGLAGGLAATEGDSVRLDAEAIAAAAMKEANRFGAT